MLHETSSEEWTEEVTVSRTIEPEWLYVEWFDGTTERFYTELINETEETLDLQLVEVDATSSFRRETIQTRTIQNTYRILGRSLIRSYWTEPVGFEIEWSFDVEKEMESRTFWTIFEWRHSLGKHEEESLENWEVIDKDMEPHGDPDLIEWPNA